MDNIVSNNSVYVDWGVAFRPMPGLIESGDLYLVKSSSEDVLIAVVDGLGHGEEAAEAARIAIETLRNSSFKSVVSQIELCHERLRRSRGVVMSLASFDVKRNIMSWVGVGNVEGLLLFADTKAKPPREYLLLRSGVVGYQIPSIHLYEISVHNGDTLIFVTDGIQSDFAQGVNLNKSTQQIADEILTKYFKGTDDALVLVARYLGDIR